MATLQQDLSIGSRRGSQLCIRRDQSHERAIHLGSLRCDRRGVSAGDDEDVICVQAGDQVIVEGDVALGEG